MLIIWCLGLSEMIGATHRFYFQCKNRCLCCPKCWEQRLTSSMNQSGAYQPELHIHILSHAWCMLHNFLVVHMPFILSSVKYEWANPWENALHCSCKWNQTSTTWYSSVVGVCICLPSFTLKNIMKLRSAILDSVSWEQSTWWTDFHCGRDGWGG